MRTHTPQSTSRGHSTRLDGYCRAYQYTTGIYVEEEKHSIQYYSTKPGMLGIYKYQVLVPGTIVVEVELHSTAVPGAVEPHFVVLVLRTVHGP